jgi:OmpA-OmpF porin, OOP family
MLGGLIGKGSSPEGAQNILDIMGKSGIDGGILENLGDMLGGGDKTAALQESGGAVVQGLFGDKADGIAGLLSQFGGVKGDTAKMLMGLAGPLLLGGMAKASPGGLNPQGLMGLLGSQKDVVASMMPKELAGLASMIPGMPKLDVAPAVAAVAAPVAAAAAPVAAAAAAVKEEEKKGGGLLWLLLGGAAVLLAAFFGPRMCSAPKVAEVSPPAVTAPTLPALPKIELPGGVTLDVAPGSIGEQLANYLKGTEATPKTFQFDNLNFETGGSTLTAESNATVSTIEAILKAYPTAEVRIEGHTDATGNAAANLKLSRDRAAAVAAIMTRDGIAANRIKTDGFGSTKPLDTTGTPEGNAKNRRIELTVTKR